METLDRIKISGFKSIREAELPLHPLNILIGPNGAGKSNFLATFRLLNQIVENQLQLFVARSGGAQTLLHRGPKTTSQLNISLAFGQNGYSITLEPTLDNTLIFRQEIIHFHNPQKYQTPFSRHLGSGHRETALTKDSGEPATIAGYVLKGMKSWQLYHFHDTSDNARVKSRANINNNIKLAVDAGNLAAFLYLLQQTQPTYYKRIVRVIQLAAPFFEDFVLRPWPFNEKEIQLEWKEKGVDEPFGAYLLSDGTLRFICLATLLLQPKEKLPSLILIDEPELGLHPYAIGLLAAMLKAVSAERQVVVTTQSVTLLNHFTPEDIVVVNRQNGESVFTRPDTPQLQTWLEAYTLGELWEKNVLGGRP